MSELLILFVGLIGFGATSNSIGLCKAVRISVLCVHLVKYVLCYALELDGAQGTAAS